MLSLRYIGDIFMIRKGTKAELVTFIKESNKKYKTIKFDLQIWPRKIIFIDVIAYKDENNNIQTTLYGKPTDQQALFHTKSDHPRSLKNSIPYSQALRLKTICSTTTEFDKNFAIIRHKFLGRQYKEKVLDEEIKKIDTIERKELFKNKEKNNKNRIPQSYNRALPNKFKIVNRNWNILQTNTEYHEAFEDIQMIAFERSKILQEKIGGHKVKLGNVFKKSLLRLNGKSLPCSSTRPSLCCTQIVNTQTQKVRLIYSTN